MRFWARLGATFLGLAGASLLVPGAALAAPAAGVDDVVAALGLAKATEPADYVVMVDTSGSMKAGGRWDSVRHELGTLVDGLNAQDRVSVMTFDATVVPRFSGLAGKNRAAVLAKLPAVASGLHTDLGAAIDAGLTVLERPETHRLAALILITDGKVDAPGSPYASVKSAAWKDLKSRASALSESHQVAAYAVSLQAATDAGLLKKVFPRASEVSAAQVGDRFANVGGDLVRLQAAEVLKKELAQPIQVTWAGDLGASVANGTPVDVQLTFASPYAHVPVTLQGIRATAPAGLRVELSGLPASVTVDPAKSVTVEAKALVTGSPSGDATAGVSATVDSPWRKAMENDLGLNFDPKLSGTTPIPAAPIKLPPTLLPLAGAIGGLVAAAALVLLLARMLLIPTMSGSLTIRRGGRELTEILLRGRRMKLVAPQAATELAGLSGSATGARGNGGKDRSVRLDARLPGVSARGLVHDGGTIALGDLEITYTSGRRRILDKIGLPRQPEA